MDAGALSRLYVVTFVIHSCTGTRIGNARFNMATGHVPVFYAAAGIRAPHVGNAALSLNLLPWCCYTRFNALKKNNTITAIWYKETQKTHLYTGTTQYHLTEV